MISIITAIHNQLAANRIFFDKLRRYTSLPFELIIVDNASTDGSREFFESVGAQVIKNEGNYSYPHCQNQGIRAARYDVLGFLNNDIIVPPDWDKNILAAMDHHHLEVATGCGIECLETAELTRQFKRRWNRIKNITGFFSRSEAALRLMHRLMYGDWEKFAQGCIAAHAQAVREGFVGNAVVIKRSALDKIGPWDERIIAADFDLYMRCKKRCQETGDIKPVHIVFGVFIHHYIRLTLKSHPPEYKDQARLISLEEKWGRPAVQECHRVLTELLHTEPIA